ncbi:hypothetical protein NQ318_014119 [Aromia moschata]|uniref:Uncharacterized protein n=1 Tax=Aromia moschata TaxID=1265417 RepID=A0AAV8XKN7_9CUCU|nr:hypothetical protein NQ318_014119 [Aromia moschata]
MFLIDVQGFQYKDEDIMKGNKLAFSENISISENFVVPPAKTVYLGLLKNFFAIKEIAFEIHTIFANVIPMKLNNQEEHNFQISKCCHICLKPFYQ